MVAVAGEERTQREPQEQAERAVVAPEMLDPERLLAALRIRAAAGAVLVEIADRGVESEVPAS